MATMPGRPSDRVRTLVPGDISRRLAVWAVVLALALSLAALVLLAEPELDLRWESHRSHFSLVLSLAAVSGGPRPRGRRGPAAPPPGR
jgi:4-hydroxybenzoate polyprenyltransferase